MKARFLIIGVLLLFAADAAAALGKVRAKSDNAVVYTGYVDEQSDGSYVLVGGGDVRTEAVLEPGTFKIDYFANFIGQRVILRARVIQSGVRPVLRVMSIRLAPEEREVSEEDTLSRPAEGR